MTKDLTKYVTTRQAAEMMGVVTEHINRLLIDGKLRGLKMGNAWLVYVPSIEKYRDTKSKRGHPPSRVPQLAREQHGQS